MLSVDQADALREIGSIGTGNGASALAALLQTKITFTEPVLGIVSFSELLDDVGQMPQSCAIVIHMGVTGDVPGTIMVAFKRDDTLKLATDFVKRMIHVNAPSADDIESTLQEFGNILAGSYLMALTSLSKVNLGLAAPIFVRDSAKKLLCRELDSKADRDVVLVKSSLMGPDKTVYGQVTFISDQSSFRKLLIPFGAQARMVLWNDVLDETKR